jgi:hypothetical protein
MWLVRWGLDHTGPLWLNAANLVGIALGCVVRYVGYRHVVWGDEPTTDPTDPTDPPATATPAPGAAGSAR